MPRKNNRRIGRFAQLPKRFRRIVESGKQPRDVAGGEGGAGAGGGIELRPHHFFKGSWVARAEGVYLFTELGGARARIASEHMKSEFGGPLAPRNDLPPLINSVVDHATVNRGRNIDTAATALNFLVRSK